MEDLMKNKNEVFKTLNQHGFAVVPIVNATGYRELAQSLQSQLDSMDTNDRVHYLQEVYDDHFVYSVRTREGGESLYKRGYSVGDNEAVTFGEDPPTEVRRKVEYVTMNMVRKVKSNLNKGGKMSKEDGTLCCEAKVEALIAHKLTRFSAKDKEWLMGLEEDQIDSLSPMEPEKPAANKEADPPQVNKEEVIDEFRGTLKTIEDYTAIMPEEMKVQIDGGVKLYKEHREALVKGILANTGTNFSEEKLNAMDDETLESIFNSIKPADYSGQGPVNNTEGDDDDVLYPAGVEVNSKKEED